MLAHGNFDGFIRGEGALYTNFFDAQVDEINSLSASRRKKVFQYFDTQVFGSDLEDNREEIERQAVFNRAKQRELAEVGQEGSDGSGNGSQEMDEEGGGGEEWGQ